MSYRLIYKVLLYCVLFQTCLASRVMALEILYPADGSYVVKSNYLVIKGGGDPLLDGMVIEIDGIKTDMIDLTPEDYRALYADKLVVEPIFDPGENKIVVEGYSNGQRVSTAKASVYYWADMYKASPTNFRREVFHLPEREAPCADCHNMQPTPEQMQIPFAANNPCASCHARMLSKAHVHGPAGVYECSYCHDPGSQPAKYQLRLDAGALCRECHPDQEDMPMLHGPVAVGQCVICHDPHASDQPGQMLAEVNELCLSCHANVAGKAHVTSAAGTGKRHPLSGPVNPARPDQRLHCSSCHDPHGGEYKFYFVNGEKVPMSICRACHQK